VLRLTGWIALAIAAALCGGSAALAQGDDSRRPRFELRAGAFFSTSSSDLRVDSTTLGLGTTINLEDDLGLESDDTTARVDGVFRFGSQQRQRIDATYFGLSREAQRIIDREIQFGDRVFPINADIRAKLDLNIFKLDYTYMFYQSDTAEVGASIGIFGVDQSASLSEVSLGGVESGDVTFPLPTLGLRGDIGLWPRITLRASGDVFFIEVGDYSGELYDLLVALEYDVFEHVGVGLGYNYADLGVSANRDAGEIDLDVAYDGALAYVKLAF
jgi:hypothetical protein